jgi:hypothetical protein
VPLLAIDIDVTVPVPAVVMLALAPLPIMLTIEVCTLADACTGVSTVNVHFVTSPDFRSVAYGAILSVLLLTISII